MPDFATHPSERAAQRTALRMAGGLSAAALGATLLVAFAASTMSRPGIIPDERTPSFPTPAGDASPARGTTGTIDLPPEPHNIVAASDGGVAMARPFSTRLASPLDRARALECLSAAVYYEAASESDAGQRAVAQVVLNRVRHPAFPATVCGVVYQGAARGSGCQFSFACDGATARIPSRAGWARAARNAAAILSGQIFAPVGLATHYHTFAVTPAWNRTLVMTDAIGAHFFHRWKGYWGTAVAFSQVYRGGEPAPVQPHVPLTAMIPAQALPPPAMIPPAPRESGAAISDAAPDPLPQSTILDRWKDSGKPLQ